MSAAVEGVGPAVEKPSEEVKATVETKAVKEKKPKASPKEKNPKQAKSASHPPYFQMIKEALLGLKEKGGSSPHAIAKYMEEKHKAVLPENFKKILGLQLKNQSARGNLLKIKASYKLSETAKKDSTTAKVTKAEKRKKTEAVVAKRGKKKKKTKKVSSIAKPKQPKSIKSPSIRTRKATVANA